MDQFQEFKEDDSSREPSGARSNWWLFAAAIALIGVAGLGVGYGLRERGLVNQIDRA
jgi:hypothetical protein